MGSLGWPEILIIAVIIIVLFGSRKLPEVGKGLGEAIRGFKQGMRGDDDANKGSGPSQNQSDNNQGGRP